LVYFASISHQHSALYAMTLPAKWREIYRATNDWHWAVHASNHLRANGGHFDTCFKL